MKKRAFLVFLTLCTDGVVKNINMATAPSGVLPPKIVHALVPLVGVADASVPLQ